MFIHSFINRHSVASSCKMNNAAVNMVCTYVLSRFSHVRLLMMLGNVARQAPLSMRFSRQEYWSGLPFPPPGDLPDPGIEPESFRSPALTEGFFTTSAPGKTKHGIQISFQFFFCVIKYFILLNYCCYTKRLYSICSYCKILAIFPVLYNINSFQYISRSGIAGSYGNSV